MNLLLIGLQALLVFLLPSLIGRGLVLVGKIYRQGKKSLKFQEKAENELVRLPFYYGLGLITIMAVAMVVQYVLVERGGFEFGQVFFPLMWVIGVVGAGVNIKYLPSKVGELAKKAILPVLGIVLLAGLVTSIWLYKSPYLLNWDWYQHQTLSRLIQEGRFSFYTTELSDTFGFNSYPPTFHLPIAIAQYPSDLTIEYTNQFWQVVSFYHLVLVGLVSWWLGWVASGKKGVAWLSTMIGMLVFDSAISFTNLFFLPQTVAAVLFTAMFASWLWMERIERKLNKWQIVTALAVLPLLHYMVGILAALVFGGMIAYKWVSEHWPKVLKSLPLVPVIVAIGIASVLMSSLVDLDHLNQGEAKFHRYEITEKVGFIDHSYGYLLYLLIPMGVAYVLMKKQDSYQINLFILFAFTLVLVADLPYVMKFYTLARFWVHLFMAWGLFSLIEKIEIKNLKAITYWGVLGALTVLLMVNILFWKSWLLYQGEFTHVAKEDVEAAEGLAGKFSDSKAILASDPATQFILEGLSGIDSVGGSYMRKPEREVLIKALKNRSAQEVVDFVRGVEDKVNLEIGERILVLSGRTFLWAEAEEEDRLSFSFNVWSPVDLSVNDWIFLREIGIQEGVTPLYSSAYLAAFKVD